MTSSFCGEGRDIWGRLLWLTKSASIKANPEAPVSISAFEGILLLLCDSTHGRTRCVLNMSPKHIEAEDKERLLWCADGINP